MVYMYVQYIKMHGSQGQNNSTCPVHILYALFVCQCYEQLCTVYYNVSNTHRHAPWPDWSKLASYELSWLLAFEGLLDLQEGLQGIPEN